MGTGTLTLSGTQNTYSGGTTIEGGVISVASDSNLGNMSGGITLSGGELLTTATFTSARSVILNPSLVLPPPPVGSGIITLFGVASTNTLAAAANTTATYTGMVFGTGGLVVGEVSGDNPGAVVLTNLTNSYTGGSFVQGGATLSVANDANLGDASGGITLQGGELLTTATGFSSARAINLGVADSNDILAAATGTTATYNGLISGAGPLTVGDGVNAGTVVLSNGANTYFGGTTVFGAMLSVNTDAELGDPSGGITLAGGELLTTTDGFSTARLVTLNPTGGANTLAATTGTTASYAGVLSGNGGLTVGDGVNAGTVVLTATNTYSGGTTITGGTLQIGNGGITGSITGNVLDNAALVLIARTW